MSLIRPCLLALALTALGAAPPPTLPISRWIEELASDDWRPAAEGLWHAGASAVPALRVAAKSLDADVVLRARVVLSRIEWGILPTTPAAVVAGIERYRDGDDAGRKSAIDALAKQGLPGYLALRLLAGRETNADAKKLLAERLKPLSRSAARGHIVRGEMADAESILEAAAAAGDVEAILDLAAFCVLTGKAAGRAREVEARTAGRRLAAYLHRALGDLKEARRLAELSGDTAFLLGVLEEMEDYKAVLALNPPEMQTPAQKADLYWRAGDMKGFEDAFSKIPLGDGTPRAAALLFNGRPRQGIEAQIKAGQLTSACVMLAHQGRWREALAMTAPPDKQSGLWLEQAVVAAKMGDRADARKLVERVLAVPVRMSVTDKTPGNPETVLGDMLRAGRRGGWLDESIADVGRILDADKDLRISDTSLYYFSEDDANEMASWRDYLKGKRPDLAPSAVLRLLADWFIKGKADKDFDAAIAAARKDHGLTGTQKETWPAALARTSTKVGKVKLAEEILADDARAANTVEAHSRHGDLLFGQKRWDDAAAAYAQATRLDPAAAAPLYLRGAALVKLGKKTEGAPLIARARLLLLGEAYARSKLADHLGKFGMGEEADAERLLVTRLCTFRSMTATNCLSTLGMRAEREGRHFDAARCYRRLFTNVAFGGGAFVHERAYITVPGWGHFHQTRGLLAAGRLDDALAEARRLWEHLPQEEEIIPHLVAALEKAGRGDEAARLFDGRLALFQRACVEAPRSAERHGRVAWMASRCRRRLDLGLRHAKLSVALTPDKAAVFDTLAEVHFQRGEKDEALAAIRRAVRLAPGEAYFAAQLRRIEAGDPKAEIPRP